MPSETLIPRSLDLNDSIQSTNNVSSRKLLYDFDKSIDSIKSDQRSHLKQLNAKINRHRQKYRRNDSSFFGLDDQEFSLDSRSELSNEKSLFSSSVSMKSNLDASLYALSDEKFKSEAVNKLLMTKDEIDINKILCLHLVSICSPSLNSLKGDVRYSSALTSYSNLLPNYILSPKTICRCKGKCRCNDISKPVKTQLSVNSQIEKIVNTALQVLARLNKGKLQILIALAYNPVYLKDLMSNETYKEHTRVISDSGIMAEANYNKVEICTVLKADSKIIAENKARKNVVFKFLLPHHFPIFQIPVFNLRTSAGALIGDPDESVPALLNLYKQVTMGKKFNDEHSGLSILPDFGNTRLAVISDDGSDFALISKSGNVVKPSSMNLTQNLVDLVRSSEKMSEGDMKIEKEDEGFCMVNYNPRPKFSKNPAVMMESLVGLAKENLGLVEKPPKMKMGISEVQRRKMEGEQLRCSILRRLSNRDRMLLAREAAERTHNQKEILRKSSHSKLEQFSTLLSSIMTKRSILSLARNSSKKEREFMFKPVNKGGLGFGDLILKEDMMTQIEGSASKASSNTLKSNASVSLSQLSSPSTFSYKENLEIETGQIRNQIIAAELREKVKNFVTTDSGLNSVNQRFHHINLSSF